MALSGLLVNWINKGLRPPTTREFAEMIIGEKVARINMEANRTMAVPHETKPELPRQILPKDLLESLEKMDRTDEMVEKYVGEYSNPTPFNEMRYVMNVGNVQFASSSFSNGSVLPWVGKDLPPGYVEI